MLVNHTGLTPPHPPHHHCPTSRSLTRLQADSQEAPSPQNHCASALPGTRAPNWVEIVTSVVLNRKVPTLISSCLCVQLSTPMSIEQTGNQNSWCKTEASKSALPWGVKQTENELELPSDFRFFSTLLSTDHRYWMVICLQRQSASCFKW